ncbi:uncharacterized protein LOC143919523 isoform X2 [Arctopsyche grandis]|uniref:uncharacterized protein LOC143919523 isoform X2 n=1 Tax=Arctopsyche grandis TaxID=121162 RepID=UPI00406D8989
MEGGAHPPGGAAPSHAQSTIPDYDDLLYCNLCNKAFAKTLQYQNHMRNHRAERRFPCIHCSKSFSQSNNLRAHLRIHTNERPFKCVECGKAFTQVTNLNNHIRLHTGERPYVCSVPGCDKAFAQVTNLNNHRRSHQKDMPYACDLCDKIFQQQNHLILHRQIHTQQLLKVGLSATGQRLTLLTCLACGDSFMEERLLKRHVRESCKEGGVPRPNIKIPGYLQDGVKKKCIFGDCQLVFNDMPSLHVHLSKDHGMLINPNQNKARRYIPNYLNDDQVTIKTEKSLHQLPIESSSQLKIPHPPSSLSLSKPFQPPLSQEFQSQPIDLKILDMEVTEENGIENVYYNTPTKFNKKNDECNKSDSEENSSSNEETYEESCDVGKRKYKSNPQNMKLVCSKCFSTFTSPASLDKHIQSKHG